ncbi:hypothetical protein HID58_015917, partial [Brassica napus]
LSSPTTALSISTPSVTLAVEQTPITILGESETHGVSPLEIVQPVTNPEDKDTTMGEAPAFNPLDPSDLTASPMVELVEKAPEKIPRASPSEVPPGPRLEQVLPAGDSACEAPVDLGPSPPSNHAVEPSPNSDQFSDPISLDPDGSIISPPSSPRSPSSPRAPSPFDPNGLHPFSPPSSDSTSVPFNNDNPIPHPAKITHLLALPAVHHPRPVKTRSPKNLLPHFTTESKFPLILGPQTPKTTLSMIAQTLLKFLCVSLPAAANSRRALVPTHLEQERYPKTSNSCLVDVTEPEPN